MRLLLTSILFIGLFSGSLSSFQIIDRRGSNVLQYRSDMYLGGWSCGFFVLHNAALIERLITGYVAPSVYTCKSVLQKKRINPKGATTSSDRVLCNQSVMRLPQYITLSLYDKKYVGLGGRREYRATFSTKYTKVAITSMYHADTSTVTHDIRAPWRYRNDLPSIYRQADAQWVEATKAKLADYKRLLSQVDVTKKPCAIHFDCDLNPYERHCVLVSVIKKPRQKPYLVFMDNQNRPITYTPARKLVLRELSAHLL